MRMMSDTISPTTRRAVPKARGRTFGNIVTLAILIAFLALPGLATGQNGPAAQAGGQGSSVTSTPPALDIDRLVAGAMDRNVLLQRSRSRPSGNSPNTMRWVGIGMLGIGGLLAINGALSTCGGTFTSVGSSISVDTSMCTGRVIAGGGVAAAGLFMMSR